ncbi:MAG: DUF1552 domain-containing protein [Myxococcales bacterium]|nr:MAG: DUF1552 domain-containing protein [Myxococcales bacterium]
MPKSVFCIPSKPIARRTLLRGVGGVALALPFLEAMQPRAARAAEGGPKRFVVFFSANGTIKDQWQPTGTETDFTLSPILAPLAAHQKDLLIMRGLNNEASYIYEPNAHDASMATLLTASKLVKGPSGTGRAGHVLDGTAAGPSIDQEIARVIGGATQLPSMELGVQSTTTILEPMVVRMCYRGTQGNAKSVPPEDDPKKVFNRLFMDSGASSDEILAQKSQRKSVLDAVLRDFQRLEAKVGSLDRQKLERHAATIRELELSLEKLGSGERQCTVPAPPEVSLNPVDCTQDGRPAKCAGDFQALGKAQMDLLTLALACDATRVITLQWSTAESTVFHKSLQAKAEHHLMSHDAKGNRADLIKINTWYAERFAYLLDSLKTQTDADGPLLDSSVVLWANELSDGDTHNRRDLGWVMAGKGNGAINTGRSVQYRNNTTNQLFASLMTMFGAPSEGFGDPQFKGTLSGLG